MSTSDLTIPRNSHGHILPLVTTAINQNSLSGLCEMLRCISEATTAYGCILWEIAPGAKLDHTPPQGRLFVLAHWFPGNETYALHDLPLQSASGEAILMECTINIEDIDVDKRVYKADPFLKRNRINAMCSVPITFVDGARGALNLYRNDARSFNQADVGKAHELSSLVPSLYQVIRDKVSQALLSKVDEEFHKAEVRGDEELRKAEVRGSDTYSSFADSRKVVQTICNLVSQTFQCVETSAFLESRLQADQFEMAATTWPESVPKQVYQKEDKGLTAWVLNSARSVKILDLAHFQRDRETIQQEYPNLNWTNSLGIDASIRKFRKLGQDVPLPPLSFMAVPVVSGSRVLGVLRCCAANVAPYYFADRELNLLQLVAARLSQYWSAWLRRCEMEEENRSWRALARSVAEMNKFVHHELVSTMPDEHRILREGLRITRSLIPAGEISDIRLCDEQTKTLYFVETHGQAWSEGTKTEIENRKKRTFSILDKPPKSAGVHVFQTGEVCVMPDVITNEFYSETFPSTKRMIIAPISSENERFGVLDIRGTGPGMFPPHAAFIAEVLGQQLGLYLYLANNIKKLLQISQELHDSVKKQQEDVEKQTQTYQDLKHQLQTPIIQVHARIKTLLKDESITATHESDLLVIRGLCGKAKRVSMNVGLFADLAKDGSVRRNLVSLIPETLTKMLIEAADDAEFVIDPDRFIRFNVERKSIESLAPNRVKADIGLLEQALSNILDNAAKYSSERTSVRIYAGLTGSGRFHVSVMNKGLKIYPEQINRCSERGWRSESAKWTTGEGSGIGLWIVKHIMKAHGGELVIMPTNNRGWTDVKLVFPMG